jgi:hypothetical protein
MEIYDPGEEKFFGTDLLVSQMQQVSEFQFLGFASTRGSYFTQVSIHIVAIPIWLPLLLAAIASISLVRARRRLLQRIKFGQCLNCGYDLRQSKEKCPECGTAIPAPAPSAV